MCGGGVRFQGGSDINGGLTDNGNFLHLGNGRTNVDAAAYLNTGGTVWGTGAAGILDRSGGANTHRKHYLQFGDACPFRNDTFPVPPKLTPGGNQSRFDGCFAELPHPCLFFGWPFVNNCARIAPTGEGYILDPTVGRNFSESDVMGPVPLRATISNRGAGGLYTFESAEDEPNFWSFAYRNIQPIGYWGLQYGNQNPANAFILSSVAAGTDPGTGWLVFERGVLLGPTTSSLIFRGAGGDTLRDRGLRGGLRRIGDEFASATSTVTITGDGYRGEPWKPNTPVDEGYAPWAIPAYVVEPTANGPTPPEGLNVFRVFKTVAGSDRKTAAPGNEPNWATPINPMTGLPWAVGDQIPDNNVIWEFIGTTPSMTVTRGAGGGQRINAADLTGQGAGVPVNLMFPDLTELTLDDRKSYSIRLRILGSKVGAQAGAHVVHELLAHASAGTLTIDDDSVTALKTPGWTFTISAPAGLTLRVACDPGADTVNFAARVEWMSLPGV